MTQRERRAALLHQAPSAARFVAVVLLVPALLLGALAWLRHEYRRSEDIRGQLARSYDRRIGQITLLSRLKDAETAQRGYLVTGQQTFLDLYAPTRGAVRDDLARARAARDGEVPAAYFDRVQELAEAKFDELDRTLALARAGHMEVARDIVRQGRGRALMSQLRSVIGDNIRREEARSHERRAAFLATRDQMQDVILIFVIVVTLVLATVLLGLWRLRVERYESLVESFDAAARNATILDSTIDAILILNPSGTVETMNAAATRMLGYSTNELLRRDIGTILDIAPGTGSFHKRVGLVGGQLRRSFFPARTVRYRDGRELPVDVAIGLMNLPDGDHLVVSLRDISERKRIERVKDDLMSTVSHELRTPLTSIVGSLSLLRLGGSNVLPENAGRLIEIAENNSRRLIRLINDMLDIDRIESGKLEIAREAIDLRGVIENACLGSEGLAREADVRLHCDAPPTPTIVLGDGDRLLQVVTNLLSNAIRAAPASTTVDVTLDVQGGRAIITVDDRGAGVPKHFRDKIFGRFERAADSRSTIGTGLGLAISREIMTRHDGAIWFEDRPGGGTRFAISLTLVAPTARREDASHKILICMADEAAARPLAVAVANEGCDSDIVCDVDAAEKALAGQEYAALMVCLDLPGDGGLAFVQRLRDRELDTPVIAIATRPRGDGEAPAMLDLVDWIEKPGDPLRLSHAIQTAIARSNTHLPVILHLDDDRDLLDVVAAALAPESRLVPATTVAEARAILQRLSPDAAILDIELAEGSGLDLIPFLFDANGLAIPTIIYSAQDIDGETGRKADAVLVKARGSIPDLKATLRRIVRTRHAKDVAA